MIFKIKYKKAGEKWFSGWWFLMCILFAGCIIFVTLYKFGGDIDTRKLEAESLYQNIYSCFVENGFLKYDFFKENKNVYDFCRLGRKGDFYFYISFFDERNNLIKNINSDITPVNENYKIICDLKLSDDKKKPEIKDSPECYKQKKVVFYYSGEQLKKGYLEILTATNNRGELQ